MVPPGPRPGLISCRRYLRLFKIYRSKYANCLLNRPKTSKIPIVNDILAGENYTADDQCKLIYGPQARLCDNIEHHNGKITENTLTVTITSVTSLVTIFKYIFLTSCQFELLV